MKKKVYLLLVISLLILSISISLFACKKDEVLDYSSLKVSYATTYKEVKKQIYYVCVLLSYLLD